jgi:HAD superfamily phosphatase (TIGR01668 family)
MMNRLRPTQAANSVLDLNLPQLFAVGKRVLIFDLDNTLCRRGARTLDPKVGQYVADVQEAGFRVGILTNRRRNADDPIVNDLRKIVPVITAAGKPRRRGYVQMLEQLDSTPAKSVMIGDKRWTDIWGASRMGIHSIRVKTYPAR